MNRLIITFLISLLLFSSCDLLDVHPYDCKIEARKNINSTNIELIERACKDKDTIRYVWTGDFQRWYDETNDMVNYINSNLKNIDFLMCGGDISDFGMTMEFELIDDIMKNLNVPYISIIGNHDVIGNGYSVYRSMYGEENFAFTAGKNRIVCLNTNALEFDYSNPVPNFSFIKNEISNNNNENIEKTIVAMHTQPYGEQFNNNVADVFHLYIKNLKNLTYCMNAHGHTYIIRDIFNDGILYYACDSVKKRSFILFTITPDGYEYEIVRF